MPATKHCLRCGKPAVSHRAMYCKPCGNIARRLTLGFVREPLKPFSNGTYTGHGWVKEKQ